MGGAGESTTEEIDCLSIVAASGDLVTVIDGDGRFRFVSDASQRLFGWDPSSLVGRLQTDFAHPDDVSFAGARFADDLSTDTVTTSYRFRHSDGSFRWVEATVRRLIPADSSSQVITIRDIARRREEAILLERRASTDPLTGVANRPVLMDRLHQGLRRLGRSSGVLAVLYLDLDRFKVINDSIGHHSGDEVLMTLAQRLAHHLRPADTLARLGGDEFVIVAESVADAAAVVALADRIIEDGRTPFLVGGEEFECTISIGIAYTNDSLRTAEDLLSEADLALYRAKDLGRDRVEVFDDEMRRTAVDRLATERMLRRALDEDAVVVEYQPIIDLRSGQPTGVEALVRLRGGDGQLQWPASFLGVAEDTGMLTTIDNLVMADAIQQAAAWRRRLPVTIFGGVAINVTARHLADVGFARAAIDQLDAVGVPHSHLHIEVSERVLMEASNSAMTGLKALRQVGVQVGLDDFGTGYCSFGYLRQFPLDFIKIDKSFVDDLETDSRERAIVAAIIVLAHQLDLCVVAEGVETSGQDRILRDLNCDRGQGFLYAASAAPLAIDHLVLGAAHPAPAARRAAS